MDRRKFKGSCGAKDTIEISSWNLHFGEEPPISGRCGSGTIFFTHCPLKCIFCQNSSISHSGEGIEISEEEFIRIMLNLQSRGAHNINLVTPTHYTLQIIDGLKKIKGKELKIPVVYNCGGFEKVETLKAIDGLVDIYMPDIKFSDNVKASKLCNAKNYWNIVKPALKEMFRQVGDLKLSETGVAERGLLIRHLVLPGDFSGTEEVMRFIAGEISPLTYVNLMSQYHGDYKVAGDPILGESLTRSEYIKAVEYAKKEGLKNCCFQEWDA